MAHTSRGCRFTVPPRASAPVARRPRRRSTARGCAAWQPRARRSIVAGRSRRLQRARRLTQQCEAVRGGARLPARVPLRVPPHAHADCRCEQLRDCARATQADVLLLLPVRPLSLPLSEASSWHLGHKGSNDDEAPPRTRPRTEQGARGADIQPSRCSRHGALPAPRVRAGGAAVRRARRGARSSSICAAANSSSRRRQRLVRSRGAQLPGAQSAVPVRAAVLRHPQLPAQDAGHAAGVRRHPAAGLKTSALLARARVTTCSATDEVGTTIRVPLPRCSVTVCSCVRYRRGGDGGKKRRAALLAASAAAARIARTAPRAQLPRHGMPPRVCTLELHAAPAARAPSARARQRPHVTRAQQRAATPQASQPPQLSRRGALGGALAAAAVLVGGSAGTPRAAAEAAPSALAGADDLSSSALVQGAWRGGRGGADVARCAHVCVARAMWRRALRQSCLRARRPTRSAA